MPGKNKTPLLGWHPPTELSAWVRAEAARRGVSLSVILTEAVEGAIAQGDIRAKIAADIRAQKVTCPAELHDQFPKPSCWTCGRNGAFERAARIAAEGVYPHERDPCGGTGNAASAV